MKNLILVLAIVILFILGCAPPRSSENDLIPTKLKDSSSKQFSSPPIKLLSARGEISQTGNFVEVNGEVQNISNEKIESLWVVINHYDANGSLITSEDSVIEYTPLMPGQKSPFKSITRRNPLMKTYKVAFKTFSDGEIDYEDARPADRPSKKKK